MSNEEIPFVYRLESDSQSGNLTGVINFCSELGGYPIYANNAYEWQIIQGNLRLSLSLSLPFHSLHSEIMLNDPNFVDNYVYTGLISQTKETNNSYWMPRNISVSTSDLFCLSLMWLIVD